MKRLFTDSKVCTGCRYCEAVCSLVHLKDEVNPRRARIKVHGDDLNGTFIPVVCRQCAKPPCVAACPYGAMYRNLELGVPIIDSTKCTGCMACLTACPFAAIFYDEEAQIAVVCDLCGGDPMCVKFCRVYPHNTHAALSYTSPLNWRRIKATSEAPKWQR